jgi:hypothetical protein
MKMGGKAPVIGDGGFGDYGSKEGKKELTFVLTKYKVLSTSI